MLKTKPQVAPRLLFNHRIGLLAVFILFTAAIAWFMLDSVKTQMQESAQKKLETVLNISQEIIDVWVEDMFEDVQLFTENTDIAQTIEQLLHEYETGKDYINSPAQQELRDQLAPWLSHHQAKDFFVFTTSGISIASSRDYSIGDIPPLIKGDKHFINALNGLPQWVLPFKSEVALPNLTGQMAVGEPTMFILVPSRNKSGSINAIFAVRLDPSGKFSTLAQIARSDNSGDTYYFNKAGQPITATRYDDQIRKLGMIPSQSRSILNLILNDPGGDLLTGFKPKRSYKDMPLTKMAKSAVLGRSGIDLKGYRNYLGLPVIGAWTWNDTYKFGLAYEMDVNEAYGSYFTIRMIVIITLFCFTALFLLILFFVEKQRHDAIIARENTARNETLLKEAQKIANLGYWELDHLSRKIKCSDETLRIFGMPIQKQASSFDTFVQTIHPDDRESILKNHKKALLDKTGYNAEHRLLLKDGSIKYVNNRCQIEFDEHNHPVRSFGTIQDITQRKLNEIKLYELSERFEMASKAAKVGVWDWDVTHNNLV